MKLTRRECVKLLVLSGVAWGSLGHAPYKQWIAYRKARLMIVAGRWEPEAFPLTADLAADLMVTVPETRAEPARAPTLRHITRLLLTRQIDLAVVTGDEARKIVLGESFKNVGPVPLRILAFLRPPYVLVCNANFERDKAYMVTFGLFDEKGSGMVAPEFKHLASAMNRANELRIPLHVGTREYMIEAERAPSGKSTPQSAGTTPK